MKEDELPQDDTNMLQGKFKKLCYATDGTEHYSNVVRMQEIGTGGAGFRFIYAAFLDKAIRIPGNNELNGRSKEMTPAGDGWRVFAYYAGRVCKSRKSDVMSFAELGYIIKECADREDKIFRRLHQLAKDNI